VNAITTAENTMLGGHPRIYPKTSKRTKFYHWHQI
jgi:hypothetical protein